MTESEAKALQAKEKAEVSNMTEQTKPGLVFTPDVDIFETEKGLTLLADMPGVKAEDLNIDLKENILTLDGDVKKPEGQNELELFTEYRTGKYYRQFNLSEIIDQSKIEAKMTDGVLRLTLPKVEAAKPRKIAIKAA
ncbi:MAG: Hsp20/alpha crystallin family protein [Deltaproteobacteria bacterium]|nr:Hsp20/alpha crystallin family protein [Deltaproteobacteria bacterium]